MTKSKEEIQAKRQRLRDGYGNLFDSISEILFRHDPIGINFEFNTDEYESEASTILPRLKDCHSPNELVAIVHEEFVRWFDSDIAGPKEKYEKIAEEIWDLWKSHEAQKLSVAPRSRVQGGGSMSGLE